MLLFSPNTLGGAYGQVTEANTYRAKGLGLAHLSAAPILDSAQESVRYPGFIGFPCLATVEADQVPTAWEVSRRQYSPAF